MLVAACSILAPAAMAAKGPASISSSSQLAPDDRPDSWTYRNPTASIAKYQRFMIVPTAVYADPAAQWGATTPQQKQAYAAAMTDALRNAMSNGYAIVDKPGKDVATMQLTLLGVKTTTKVVATASRLTPFGLALNGVKSLAGKEGSFSGSVQAAFELKDSRTGELLFAAIRRRSPDALDIGATMSTQNTVNAVAKDIAGSIKQGIDRANGR
jgi:hypothetical protein